MSSLPISTAIRGRFLDIRQIVAQPTDLAHQVRYLEDGLLITEQGKIVWFGPWQEGQTQLPAGILVEHYPEQLIVPGFIDTHIHY
ncbi:MAG TPA: guanine deaminase, partial [Acinetobacter radioresistens]|nr:guanine deaminase [Acinetobacter radioresistens]